MCISGKANVKSIRSLGRGRITGVLALAAVALWADTTTAQIARQRATFAVKGTTVLGITGRITGIIDESDSPIDSKLLNVVLQPQSNFDPRSFDVAYSGTVTADISFDTNTHQITGIHIAESNLVAGNLYNVTPGDTDIWIPGQWDPNKYPNGKEWDPGETIPQGQKGGFPNNGTDPEAANYAGSIGGFINFAQRNLRLSTKSQGTVFPVSSGNFPVTSANRGFFIDGQVDDYSPQFSSDIEQRYQNVDFRNFEVDTLAVQPETFDYTDSMGVLHTGVTNGNRVATPVGPLLYPSGIVWRYILTNANIPVYDALGQPVYNTPGDPMSGQVTRNFRTYGALAPAFDSRVGTPSIPGGSDDIDWFNPNAGDGEADEIGKPDAVRVYVPSTTEFDVNGNPIMIHSKLELPNLGKNWANGAGTIPVLSSINLNGGTGKYDLAMNIDLNAAFFVGDFPVLLHFGQTVQFGQQVPATGQVFADSTLSLKAGDVNNDGVVNIFDINMVSANWSPKPNPDLYAGDANNDGIVNIFDINLISSNWTPSAATPVPEPSTVVLAIIGGVAVLLGCRRRTR